MLGLRFFACSGCETVYADVERPARCPRCGREPVEELAPESGAVDYFTDSGGGDR